MPKTRRLSDLYVVGKDVIFDDDTDDPITVHLRKLNPLEQEQAVRKANAARSTFLAGKGERAEDEMAVVESELDQLNREQILERLVDEEVDRMRLARESQLAAEEEWANDNYLQGLRDAWDDGLQMRWASGEKDDPDVAKVWDELQRFQTQLDEKLDQERARLTREYDGLTDLGLREKLSKSRLKLLADFVWMNEFRRYEIFYATRDAQKHTERYFQHRDEVDMLDTQVLLKLISEYQSLAVPVTEGKDSPETPDS